jgi:hypothetical protein
MDTCAGRYVNFGNAKWSIERQYEDGSFIRIGITTCSGIEGVVYHGNSGILQDLASYIRACLESPIDMQECKIPKIYSFIIRELILTSPDNERWVTYKGERFIVERK